jgi:hypothetical protein
MGKVRNAFTVLARKPRISLHGTPRFRCGVIIIDLKKIGWQGEGFIHLVQDVG